MGTFLEPQAKPAKKQWRWMLPLRCLFVSILLLHASWLPAWESPTLGFASEASYLVKIPRFVDWPASAFRSTTSPLHVCIMGEKSFADVVRRMAIGETIGSRSLLILLNPKLVQLGECHELFLSSLPSARVRSILKEIAGKPVLTMAESRDFLDQGGMIQFFFTDTLKFNIDLEAARHSGLGLRSTFLALASSVRKGPE